MLRLEISRQDEKILFLNFYGLARHELVSLTGRVSFCLEKFETRGNFITCRKLKARRDFLEFSWLDKA